MPIISYITYMHTLCMCSRRCGWLARGSRQQLRARGAHTPTPIITSVFSRQSVRHMLQVANVAALPRRKAQGGGGIQNDQLDGSPVQPILRQLSWSHGDDGPARHLELTPVAVAQLELHHLRHRLSAHRAQPPPLLEDSARARDADASMATLEQHGVSRPLVADPAAVLHGVGRVAAVGAVWRAEAASVAAAAAAAAAVIAVWVATADVAAVAAPLPRGRAPTWG
mmetsp:Transcript_13863/g.41059  ORF Transcript_13863/g.41059 Transcript_13863/m.41059 type:complete len:225 (-) Transcript_13863:190-864(-)